MIWTSQSTCFNTPTVQTANVLAGQVAVVIKNRAGDTEVYSIPSGSIVLSPEYFKKLSESIAVKDKLLLQGNVARQSEWLALEKKLYIDTHYGIKSGAEIMVGGRLELML